MWKTVLSWVIAIIVSIIFVRLIFFVIGAMFKLTMLLIVIIPVIILALPLFIIIRKKLLK